MTFWGFVTLAASPTGNATEGGKTLRLNLNEDLQTTSPFFFSGLTTHNILSQAYEGFTALGPSGEIVPALATSWNTPDGGVTWRFVLRTGVHFHSGRLFTAADVRWTFLQLLKPTRQPGIGTYALHGVVGAQEVQDGHASELAGLTIIDPHTVEIRLVEPDALLPLSVIFIADSGVEADFGPEWATVVSAGTGPFKLASWRRAQEVVLIAHHDYWGGAPAVESARFAIVPHPETLLALFDSGNLDFVVVPEASTRSVLGDPRYADQRRTFPRSQLRYLGLNQSLYQPFRDIRVREAMILALDRESVVKTLYKGAATTATGAIPPGVGGFRADNVSPLPYDPARARRLIAEAGYGPEHPLPPLELVAADGVRDEVTVYAGQLSAALGITVGIRILDRATVISSANQGLLPFFLSGWTADYSDAMSILMPVWSGSSVFNRSRWRNPAFDRLVDRAKATADNEQRYALAQEAERVLTADRAMVPLPVPMIVTLVRDGVTGVRLLPTGTFDLRAAAVP